ncbi:hypothetical protein BGX21_000276 [Mortierella sp. AD011]|nr:hypothetical protein BGX20_009609 [Mortierella sp. AD010]KAF9388600.1 hypothetical protein BGX21_000276 [Mortierella sp. AD011]
MASCAWTRQILIYICIIIVFTFQVIIMGCVGVHGRLRLSDGTRACILFMEAHGNVILYNNSFCLFPLVGAAVIAGLTFIFLIVWTVLIFRQREVSPKPISMSFMTMAIFMALLSFAICAEIGIGLTKGCNILPPEQRSHCRTMRNFNALWASEICAGISGGLLIIALVLELFQFMIPPHYPSSRVTVAVDSDNHKVSAPNSTANTPRVETAQPQATQYHPSQIQPQIMSPPQFHQQQFSQPPPDQYQYQPYPPPPPQNMPAAHGTSGVDTMPTQM